MSAKAYGKHRKKIWIDEVERRKRWDSLGVELLNDSKDKGSREVEVEATARGEVEVEAEAGIGSGGTSISHTTGLRVKSDGKTTPTRSHQLVSIEKPYEESSPEISPSIKRTFSKFSGKSQSQPTKITKSKKFEVVLPDQKTTPSPESIKQKSPKSTFPTASQPPSRLSKQENDAWGFFDDIISKTPIKKSNSILSKDIDLAGHDHSSNTESIFSSSPPSLEFSTNKSVISLVRKDQNEIIISRNSSSQSQISRDSDNSISATSVLSYSSLTRSTPSIPGSPTGPSKRISQVTTKRTYGSKARRYIEEDDHDRDVDNDENNEHGDDSNDTITHKRFNLGFLNTIIDNDENEEEHEEIALKNFDELRAHGVNTQFINDVQFIIESFQEGCNDKNLVLQRTSLLQIASKSLDKEFIIGFKSTNFPMILLTEMKDCIKDDYNSFLFGVILCRLLEEGGVGIGSYVAQNDWIINLLIEMLGDEEDILKKRIGENEGENTPKRSILRKISKKKKNASPFQSSLIKFIESMNTSLTSSRSLTALSVFISLEKLGPRINNLILIKLANHVDDFLVALQKLMNKLFFKDDKMETEEDESIDYQLQLLYMIIIQLELLADGDELGLVLRKINDGLPPIVYALTLSERFIRGEQGIVSKLKNFTISTLRILISLTSNVTNEEYLKQIYDAGLAEGLTAFITNRSTNEYGLKPDDDIYLYASGLLVNLVDGNGPSQSICSMLLHNKQNLSSLKQSIFNNHSNHIKLGRIEVHIVGCEYLLLGLLATNEQIKDSKSNYFSPEDIILIREGLTQFESKLSNKIGYELHKQITTVLDHL